MPTKDPAFHHSSMDTPSFDEERAREMFERDPEKPVTDITREILKSPSTQTVSYLDGVVTPPITPKEIKVIPQSDDITIQPAAMDEDQFISFRDELLKAIDGVISLTKRFPHNKPLQLLQSDMEPWRSWAQIATSISDDT